MNSFLRLLFLLILTTGVVQAQEPTTHTLVVAAQSLTAEPMAGVKFEHRLGGASRSFQTGEHGTVRFRAQRDRNVRDGSDFNLTDDRYRLIRITERAGDRRGTRFITMRLAPTDVGTLEGEELKEYVLALPELLANERERAKKLTERLRLSAFLEGSRQERSLTTEEMRAVLDREMEPQTEPTPTPTKMQQATTLVATVVDSLGNPVAGRRVVLFALDEDSGKIMALGNRTSNARGLVFFIVDPSRLHRLEIPPRNDGLTARGPILQVVKGQQTTNPPLVLREGSRTVSGVLFHGESPLANVVVTAQGRGFSTKTDRLGYFELAPIDPGEVLLHFTLPGNRGSAELLVPAGERELFIPMELLSHGM